MTPSTAASGRSSGLKTVLLSGFVAGSLDILAAIAVYALLLKKTTALKLLQSIASGVLGKSAFSGGTGTALYGLLFHFFIAFAFAAGYFLLFPLLPFLRRHKLISGILYGCFVWVFMNLLLLPLVFVQRAPVTAGGFFIGVTILIMAVGIPISWITHRHYCSKERRE